MALLPGLRFLLLALVTKGVAQQRPWHEERVQARPSPGELFAQQEAERYSSGLRVLNYKQITGSELIVNFREQTRLRALKFSSLQPIMSQTMTQPPQTETAQEQAPANPPPPAAPKHGGGRPLGGGTSTAGPGTATVSPPPPPNGGTGGGSPGVIGTGRHSGGRPAQAGGRGQAIPPPSAPPVPPPGLPPPQEQPVGGHAQPAAPPQQMAGTASLSVAGKDAGEYIKRGREAHAVRGFRQYAGQRVPR